MRKLRLEKKRYIRIFDVISSKMRFTKEEAEVREKRSHLTQHAKSELLTL